MVARTLVTLTPWSYNMVMDRQKCILRRQKERIVLSSVQSLSCVSFFVIPWTAARQASLSITNSQSLLKLVLVMPSTIQQLIELVMPSTISSSVIPFSCLQSFPVSGSFLMSQFLASGGQSIEVSVSASVIPTNIQD